MKDRTSTVVFHSDHSLRLEIIQTRKIIKKAPLGRFFIHTVEPAVTESVTKQFAATGWPELASQYLLAG